MKRLLLNVQKEFCEECALALRRFIGRLSGVESITTEEGIIEIRFNESIADEKELLKITRESIERLGYKLLEEERLRDTES